MYDEGEMEFFTILVERGDKQAQKILFYYLLVRAGLQLVMLGLIIAFLWYWKNS